jgi:hypothetical protein
VDKWRQRRRLFFSFSILSRCLRAVIECNNGSERIYPLLADPVDLDAYATALTNLQLHCVLEGKYPRIVE